MSVKKKVYISRFILYFVKQKVIKLSNGNPSWVPDPDNPQKQPQHQPPDFLALLGRIANALEELVKLQGGKAQPTIVKPTLDKPIVRSEPPLPSENHVENAKHLFPESLMNMLNFTQERGYIIIKPRQFLGSENFAKIAAVVRDVGGEYVSAGKESHFRLSVK